MKKIVDLEYKPEKLVLKIVQDNINLYKGFSIVNIDKDFYCLIAHRNIISVYSIFDGCFVKHIKFINDVEKLIE